MMELLQPSPFCITTKFDSPTIKVDTDRDWGCSTEVFLEKKVIKC